MNYGFNPTLERAHRDPEKDWRFGAMSVHGIGEIPTANREQYLPQGEVQRGKEDTCDCASRGPNNKLEADFTYAFQNLQFSVEGARWLHDNGYVDNNGKITFSDRFVAINSGTTRAGNSLKAPCEAIRTQGLIPKKMLPLEAWMSFDDYIDPSKITQAMRDLGNAFKDRFEIEYEQVYQAQFKALLATDMLDVGVYAWPLPVNGEYPTIAAPFNHVVAMIRPEYYVYDNYVDAVDGDFIKKLASNYFFFEYGYRIYIAHEYSTAEIEQRRQAKLNLLMQILLLCQKMLAAFGPKLGRIFGL